MMQDIIIKNGTIFDPINNIDGEVMDIALSNGKIVDRVNESKALVIDATNKIVLPGGVDIHSHIAGLDHHIHISRGRLRCVQHSD